MLIDSKSLEELKTLHESITGVRLTDSQATEMGLNLITATRVVFGLDSKHHMCHNNSKAAK